MHTPSHNMLLIFETHVSLEILSAAYVPTTVRKVRGIITPGGE